MTTAAGTTLGGLALIFVLAYAAGDGRSEDGARPGETGTATALASGPASSGPAPWALATSSAQAADVTALEELLAAADGLRGVACELVVRGMQDRWGGSRRPLKGASEGSLRDRIDAGVRAADSAEGARVLVEEFLGGSGCRADAAFGLLDRVEPEAATTPLRAALQASAVETRRRAALGLGAIDSHDDRLPLERLLADADPRVRTAAAWALGEIEEDASIPALTQTLSTDTDARVRRAAAHALGEIAG